MATSAYAVMIFLSVWLFLSLSFKLPITSQCLLVAISLALRNAWCYPSPHLA